MIRDKILSKLEEKLDFKSLHSGMINAAAGPAKSKYKLDDHKRNWQEVKTKKEYDSLIRYHKNQAGGHTGQGSRSENWLTKDGHKVQSSHHAPFPSVHKLTSKEGETQYFIDTPKRTREKFESGQKKTVKEEVDFLSESYEYGKSASHKDKDGYTVTVATRKDKNHKLNGGKFGDHFEHLRHGTFTIKHPNGETVHSGYWMDHPEKGWKHNGVDLHKDHFEHVDKGTPEKSVWRSKIPVQKRLEIEAKQQATAYDSLKNQFKNKKASLKEEVELVNEMALTTASVNKYLKSKGVDDKLYRGKGYYYFDGDDVGNWPETSVYVNHISSIPTVEGWYEEWKRLSSKSYKSEPLERNKDGKLVIRLGKRR